MTFLREFFARIHRAFVPSEDNGYRPTLLEKAAATGMLLLILLTFTLVNIQSIALLTSHWLSSAILPSVLIDLTNENRTDESLGSLKHNPLLDEAAQLKAADMAQHEYFAHDSPAGITPWYWFGRVGYEYTYAGENLAVHFTDSDEVVKAWMKSPGHRANIMSGNYTEIGIGTAKGEYKGAPTIFVVQLFGRPMTYEEKVRVAEAERVLNPTIEEVVTPEPPANEDVAGVSEVRDTMPVATTTPTTEVIIDLDEAPAEVAQSVATDSPALSAENVAPLARQTVVMSDNIATISPYIARGVITLPAGENGGNTAQVRESHILSQFAVRPHVVLETMYALLALVIAGVLVVSVVREWRRAHLVQVAYGFGLMATMWVALYVHVTLLSGVLIA